MNIFGFIAALSKFLRRLYPDNRVVPPRDGFSRYQEAYIMKKALLAAALAVSSIGMAHAAGFAIGGFVGAGAATSGTQGGSMASSGSASVGPGVAVPGTTAGRAERRVGEESVRTGRYRWEPDK